MTQIAVPLRLGEMGETHFVLGRHWFSHFERLARPLTVAKLREAIDQPGAWGCRTPPRTSSSSCNADQANLAFRRHGGPWTATLDDLPTTWSFGKRSCRPRQRGRRPAIARGRCSGLTVSPLRNASNVSDLAERLGETATKQTAACRRAGRAVWRPSGRTFPSRRMAPSAFARPVRPARSSSLFLLRGKARIEQLAGDAAGHVPRSNGTSFRKAGDVLDVLGRTHWSSLRRSPGWRTTVRTPPGAFCRSSRR